MQTSPKCYAIQAAMASTKAAEAEEERLRALRDPFSDASLAAAMNGSAAPDSADPSRPSEKESTPPSIPLKRPREEETDPISGSSDGIGVGCDEANVEKHSDRQENRGQDEEEKEEGRLTMLTEAHLGALANAPPLRRALKDASLQKLLHTIDRSRSRLDALEAALHNNPDFSQFCAEVRATIALAGASNRRR